MTSSSKAVLEKGLSGPILCGTDFSENAKRAGTAAATIAGMLSRRLILLHAFEQPVNTRETDLQPLISAASECLHAEAQRLRKAGADVEERLVQGFADAVLLKAAQVEQPALIVVSSLGRRAPARWLLGSVSERVAEAASAPTLVIRSDDPFETWKKGKPLTVLVAADFSASSDSALRLVAFLQQIGPCSITVAHVTYPAGHLLDAGEAANPTLKPEYRKAMEDALQDKISAQLSNTTADIRIDTNWGRIDNAVLLAAADLNADVVIVGTHSEAGAAEWWHTSVSRGVLHRATTNVACAPS